MAYSSAQVHEIEVHVVGCLTEEIMKKIYVVVLVVVCLSAVQQVGPLM